MANFEKGLDSFVGKFFESNRIINQISRKACGWIPVIPRNSCVKDNILLADDAAGHTHPVPGTGIFAAVMCGKKAGKAAVDSLNQQDIGLLSNYDKDWQSLFGKTLSRASDTRKFMESNWDDFEDTIKQTWVAYEAYCRTKVSAKTTTFQSRPPRAVPASTSTGIFQGKSAS